MILVLLVALFSGYALVFMFSKKVEAIRLGDVETNFVDMPIFRHVEIGTETLYQNSKKGLKHAEIALYNVLLLALHKIIPTYKNVSAQVETKLVDFTQMVKGRRMLHTRGASSLFLRDIAEHKKSTVPERAPIAPSYVVEETVVVTEEPEATAHIAAIALPETVVEEPKEKVVKKRTPRAPRARKLKVASLKTGE